MLNFTHATKVLAIAIIMSAFACSKKDINEPQLPSEKGHFSVQINNAKTKAEDPFLTKEKTITNLYLFLYDASVLETEIVSAPCIVMHPYTAEEREATGGPTAVFSLPKTADLTATYKIYAVANTTQEWTEENKPTRKELEDAFAEDLLGEYNKGTYAEAIANNGILPNELGFLMSGVATDRTPSTDNNVPTVVSIPLKRAACKIKVNANITQTFFLNYGYKYGSTIRVTDVIMSNLYAKSHIISKTTVPDTYKSANDIPQTVTGHPSLNVVDTKVPIALMYSFENGITAQTEEASKPTIKVKVMYDFDGPGPQGEIPLEYDAQIIEGDLNLETPGPKGKLSRNTIYTINVEISGLSAREVKATITVEDWLPTVDQNANFGG